MARFIVTLPNNMDFNAWSSAVVQDLKDVNIPLSNKFQDWIGWANALQEFTQLGNVPTATLSIYPGEDGWKKWAMQFINNLPPN